MKNVFAALMVFALLACAGSDEEDQRTQHSEGDSQVELIDLSSQTIDRDGQHVYIVCFYGENDHDDLAQRECENKYRACVQRYGNRWCHKVVNPTQDVLNDIDDEGIVIVVTHTTPSYDSGCDTGVDIWDSPLTPTDVSNCIEAPIVWFGCYGKQIADHCENVIPLADTPEILDSREPETHCRFYRTILCIEELTRRGRPFSQADVVACVERKKRQGIPRDCR